MQRERRIHYSQKRRKTPLDIGVRPPPTGTLRDLSGCTTFLIGRSQSESLVNLVPMQGGSVCDTRRRLVFQKSIVNFRKNLIGDSMRTTWILLMRPGGKGWKSNSGTHRPHGVNSRCSTVATQRSREETRVVATDKHVNDIRAIRQPPVTTIEKLLEAVYSVGSAPRLYSEDPRPAEWVSWGLAVESSSAR
jgi:hypothetical protein